jgi:membrane protein implicated in regulation of membrane protease activity
MVAGVLAAVAAVVAGQRRLPEVAAYVPVSGALVLAAGVFVGVGVGLTLREPDRAKRGAFRVLSWWWVLIGVVLIVVSMWTATAVLLFLADAAPDAARRVELRLDAMKTGLTVGAGAAGLVALLLGVRRQWLGERTQVHQEYDAGEKRVTELYTKATDQLGHDKAAVRLAGLHALERVAQNNSEHRQTVVDVICAYLRMPPILSGSAQRFGEAGEDPAHREQEIRSSIDPQELQVRITAQRILRNHLRWSRSERLPPDTFWAGIDLNLTGAWLVKLDLVDCRMGEAGFGGATFEGFARFDGATFEGRTTFAGAVFTGRADWGDANYMAGFAQTLFKVDAIFRETVFALRADFRAATFEKMALFSRTVFRDWAVFRDTAFQAETIFGGATFKGEAVFRRAEFRGGVSLREATFATAPALWEATAAAAPGVQRSWPAGWGETVDPAGSGGTRLVRTDVQAGEPPHEPDRTHGGGSMPEPDGSSSGRGVCR